MTAVNGLKQTFEEEVPVSQIFLDKYGGDFRPLHVAKLVKNWDRRFVGVPVLSLRSDGRFACLDGWHRAKACEIVEGSKSTLRCEVMIDLTYEDEARIWHELNKVRRQPTPFAIFNSWREAGDTRALAVDAVVKQVGLELSPHRAEGLVNAVNAVLKVYDLDGGPLLRKALALLKEGWVNARVRDRFPAASIDGLAQFFVRYPDADQGSIRAILQREGPSGMQAQALRVRESEGTSNATCWGKGLRTLYNFKRSSHRLPEWAERMYSPGGRVKQAIAATKRNKARARKS